MTTTTTLSARRARGIHPKGDKTQQSLRGKGSYLPEYLEPPEVQTVVASAPNPPAKPVMRGQLAWRRRVETRTLRHSNARRLLMHGIPINHLILA